MKAIPAETRIRNRIPPRSLREKCKWCGDTGNVTIRTRQDDFARRVSAKGEKPHYEAATSQPIEEVGPCPFCEMGYDLEFPSQDDVKTGKRIRPPWGMDGFWQGRETADVEPLYPTGTTPLPHEENKRHMRELMERLAQIGRQMP